MTVQLTLIAAVAANRGIGRNNELLWQIPEDMAHFKALTTGRTVIMGRKTWESLPEKFRPLPGRRNIVVTRNRDYQAPGAEIVHSLPEAVAVCEAAGVGSACIMGGAELYAQALPIAHALELTEIDATIDDADAFFPEWKNGEWQETRREAQTSASPRYAHLRFAFVTYQRS
jgi:dihydrofolate reductase